MDPEIARIFQESTAVSTIKGNSHNLLKVSYSRVGSVVNPTFQIMLFSLLILLFLFILAKLGYFGSITILLLGSRVVINF